MSRHYFPTETVTKETMGAAIWLEKRQFENLKNAVLSGINMAFQ